jgi:hypothetical protein
VTLWSCPYSGHLAFIYDSAVDSLLMELVEDLLIPDTTVDQTQLLHWLHSVFNWIQTYRWTWFRLTNDIDSSFPLNSTQTHQWSQLKLTEDLLPNSDST